MVPHLVVPHLLWVVVSLLGAATSGRLLAAALEEDDPREESVWLAVAAFVAWCWVSMFGLWWVL
jgi:hypothetical protein